MAFVAQNWSERAPNWPVAPVVTQIGPDRPERSKVTKNGKEKALVWPKMAPDDLKWPILGTMCLKRAKMG